MHITRHGKYFRVSRITGPTHNLLGLHLSRVPGPETAEVIDLTPGKGDLDGDAVRRCAAEGVEEANARLGTRFHLLGVEFRSDDSPPARMYRKLAICLVEHAAAVM